QAKAINTPDSMPKSSIHITVQAIGVFVAPAKTATNPIPASKSIGRGTNQINALPNVAPIKNNGVTSPPLKPAPSVNEVNSNLSKKSYEFRLVSKASTMVGIPNPIYFVVPIR